jgi:predicted transcriptional regulator
MTRTLHIQIGKRPDRNDLDERLGAIDAGEDIEPRPSRLSIESLETFGRIFRPTNLELLEAIGEHEPGSIRELARLVDRHPPEVTENVHELSDYGLIELVEDGRAMKPTLWYDEIEFSGDVPLAGLGGSSDDAAALS